jgi:pantoate--beta-alanine ligase
MLTFRETELLTVHLAQLRQSGKTIGFVPTMGALHDGHLSLLNASRAICDVNVVSIFVNPTQFNDPSDFDRYPRTFDDDNAKLADFKCDILFAPAHSDMYPTPDNNKYKFGHLDTIMEAKHREGHFNGVGMIVRRLFEVVKPDKAFFGQKDYQQLMVIKSLNEQYNLGVDVVGCPIIREESGLAMSSRNELLGDENRRIAKVLSSVLLGLTLSLQSQSLEESLATARATLQSQKGITLEYLEAGDAASLGVPEAGKSIVVCVAAFVGGIRLIDNVVLPFPKKQ